MHFRQIYVDLILEWPWRYSSHIPKLMAWLWGVDSKCRYIALIIFSVKPENVRLVATNIGDEACQNDSVSLSCSADASPPVSSYQFFENDVLLGSNNSGMWTTSLSSSGMLIYRCVASNVVGAANSANVSIDVGGTVSCTCQSLRLPPPFLLEEWFFYRFEQKKESKRKSPSHISFSNSFTSSKKLTFRQFVREIGDSLPIQARTAWFPLNSTAPLLQKRLE